MLRNYSTLAIFGAAFITQILAMVGISPSINGMVWNYGVFLAIPVINMLYILLVGYAYDSVAVLNMSSSTASAAEKTAAYVAQGQISREFALFFGWTAAMSTVLYINNLTWEESQKKATDALEKGEESGEEEAALFGLFSF